MKLFFIVILYALSVYSYSQIGINTDSPLGVFHVQGGTASLVDNSVIVDTKGNLSIGNSSLGKAKVEITGNSPLLVQTGSESEGYALTSIDANGNLDWRSIGKSFVDYTLFAGNKSFNSLTQYLLRTVTVPEAGQYMATIRWWGTVTTGRASSRTNIVSAYFTLMKTSAGATTSVDQIEYYINYWVDGSYITPLIMLQGTYSANDQLSVYILPSVPTGSSTWLTGPQTGGTSPYHQPVIIVSKL